MRAETTNSGVKLGLVGLVAALLLLATMLTSCGGGGDDGGGEADSSQDESTTEPVAGGNVSVGLALNVDGINPMSSQYNSSNHAISKAVYDPIAVLGTDGSVQPYLVESIEPNDDFTQWTLTTRDGIRWHNGDEFTPQDLARHIKNVQLGPYTSFGFDTIDVVAVVDESARPAFDAGDMSEEEYDVARRQVLVLMSEPWSSFPSYLASNQMAYVAHPDFEAGEIADPIGTGPFKLDELVLDSHARVVKNEDYWREGLPYLDQVDYRFLVDPESRRAALEAGDVDMINTQAFDQVVELEADAEIQKGRNLIEDGSDGDEITLLINTQVEPMNDLDVRRALQLATDREVLNDSLYDGHYEIADAPFRSSSPWYTDPGWPDADADAAAEMIAEWEDENGPLEISLSVLSSTDQLELGQALAAQWDAVGATVEIKSIDAAGAGTTLATGDYNLFMFTYFNGADPDENFPFWDPDLVGEPGDLSINLTRYTSDDMAEIVLGARETDDFDERAALYGDLWKEFADQVPQIWLFHADFLMLADDTIHGLNTFTSPEGTELINHYWGSVYFTEVFVTG